MVPRQRDAKGHFAPEADGPTAKMRALEAQVAKLTAERDNWLADFNRCADELVDAQLTIDRQAKIIANHTATEPTSPLVAVIAAALVSWVVGLGMGRFGR